jgi:hypothetical protein
MRRLSLLVAVPLAGVALVVLTAVVIVATFIGGEIFAQVAPQVSGPAGVGPGAVEPNVGLMIIGTVGALSVPAAVLLSLLLGGRAGGREPDPPRGGGPL